MRGSKRAWRPLASSPPLCSRARRETVRRPADAIALLKDERSRSWRDFSAESTPRRDRRRRALPPDGETGSGHALDVGEVEGVLAEIVLPELVGGRRSGRRGERGEPSRNTSASRRTRRGEAMAHARPFRFGVFGETARSRGTLLDTARRAEDSGYATFLIRDHFIEEPFGHQLAPLTALATVAGATTGLRVGSLVLANDYRHPVILAKEVATLDVLSNGRVKLGLGAGFSQAEYDRAGIRFDPPGVRVDRLEEAIHVLKGLFAAGPLTFAGKHYSVTHFDSFPKPVQRPHPPILVGAAGKRMLSIAAREADIIGFQTVSTQNGVVSNDPRVRLAPVVAQKVEQVRHMAGDRFDRIELSMVATVII